MSLEFVAAVYIIVELQLHRDKHPYSGLTVFQEQICVVYELKQIIQDSLHETFVGFLGGNVLQLHRYDLPDNAQYA